MLKPKSKNVNALFAELSSLGIEFINHDHPPLRTVEESRSLRGNLPGVHIKNLFLRDKKRKYFLVVVSENRRIDLKWLRRYINASGTLSFGSPDALFELLGVEPGAVSPLSVFNDVKNVVTLFLDKSILSYDVVNAHPLRNDMTTALSPKDLERFMTLKGHPPKLIDFEITN